MQLVPSRVSDAVDRWIDLHDRLAPGAVEGCYLVGSVAFGDWTPRSDIDIVAVCAEPADDEQADALRAAHDAFYDDHRATTVDGPYVAWGDLSVPPQPLHRPWTEDGRFHHDAECFELNPIVWYTLARYGIAVRGPHSDTLEVDVDGEAREAFVVANTASYWRPVHAQVTDAVQHLPEGETVDGPIVAWCLLGAARMLYTYDTGDVTSKTAAGQWASRMVPGGVADAIEQAIDLRTRPSSVTRDDALTAVDAMATLLGHIPDPTSERPGGSSVGAGRRYR